MCGCGCGCTDVLVLFPALLHVCVINSFHPSQEQQWPPHSPPLTSPLMGEFSSPSPNLPQRTSSDAGEGVRRVRMRSEEMGVRR